MVKNKPKMVQKYISFQNSPNGLKFPKCFKIIKKVQIVPKWSKMFKNCPKWSLIVQNLTKLSKIFPSG